MTPCPGPILVQALKQITTTDNSIIWHFLSTYCTALLAHLLHLNLKRYML